MNLDGTFVSDNKYIFFTIKLNTIELFEGNEYLLL